MYVAEARFPLAHALWEGRGDRRRAISRATGRRRLRAAGLPTALGRRSRVAQTRSPRPKNAHSLLCRACNFSNCRHIISATLAMT
jgi:hypothetical protein